MKKKNIGILCGGKSAEHKISLLSTKSILEAIDQDKYNVYLIGINKEGRCYLNEKHELLSQDPNPDCISLNNLEENKICFFPGEDNIHLPNQKRSISLDVVFPVLHGPFGEDGSVQGLLSLLGVPFVGAGVLGSAIGMDKDVMKRLLKEAGFPVANFIVVQRRESSSLRYQDIVSRLGNVFFVKPANMGSSIGIHKVEAESQFSSALKDATQYDDKIIMEEFIQAREIEVSVLGNKDPIASLPGEVVPHNDFYSYRAKYLDEKATALDIPAVLSQSITEKFQKLAKEVFLCLNCKGMARIDFFMDQQEKIWINEINTIPGFTKISMYPKLWEVSGISYNSLLDKLIESAKEV